MNKDNTFLNTTGLAVTQFNEKPLLVFRHGPGGLLEVEGEMTDEARDMLTEFVGGYNLTREKVRELEQFKVAYMEWSDKTDWVQGDKRFDVLLPWGKHRADVLRLYIERLEKEADEPIHQVQFVVFFIDFNNEERYSGVFSSKEKAEAYIARFAEPKNCFRIEEVIVDSE